MERKKYELLFPIEDTDKKEEKTAAQLAEERAKAREKAKHLAELAIKNPETEEWHLYKATKGKRKHAKEQKILKQKRHARLHWAIPPSLIRNPSLHTDLQAATT